MFPNRIKELRNSVMIYQISIGAATAASLEKELLWRLNHHKLRSLEVQGGRGKAHNGDQIHRDSQESMRLNDAT